MFAIIKFTDEEKSRIVDIDDIKHFDLAQMNKRKFLVKYEDGMYYPAQVVVVKDSIEELEEFKNKKRLNFKNRDLLQSASESDDELGKTASRAAISLGPKKILVKENKKKSIEIKDKNMQQSFLTKYQNINLNKSRGESDANPSPNTINPSTSLANNVNNELQKMKEANKKLLQQLEDLKQENKELLKLNIDLQKTVIDQFKNMKINTAEGEIQEELKAIGATVKDQVHLGRGIYISKACFNDAWFRSTSGSHFVKTIALYVFGSQTLINSSVTGKSSNNYKKAHLKPALDPTKLSAIEDIYKYYLREKQPDKNLPTEIRMIKTYIANKISDLNRTVLRQKKKAVVKKQ